MAASNAADSPPVNGWRLRLAIGCAYAAAWAIVIPAEIERWQDQPPQLQTIFGWFTNLNIDSSPYLLWLLMAPLFWLWPRHRRFSTAPVADSPVSELPSPDRPSGPWWRGAGICLLVATTSMANSAWIGGHFDQLPPAYHDEYSYLIQARTFAAGRLSFPSPPEPEMFDQIHVLNLGKFASRYFPGTGAWLAPFHSLGHPVWGQWVASALAAVFFTLAARELAGDFAGAVTGLLVALSPGISLFSNLILAHQPTLLGLGLFLYGWLVMVRTKSFFWGLGSGAGLSFAMLCRPMTAGAVAFPFGVWMLISGIRAWRRDGVRAFREWFRLWVGMAVPLICGGLILFAYDDSITGDGWLTPYSQYTATYTPRHVFGFDNVINGEQRVGPRVMESYDLWAENLTPRLAARNAVYRLLASSQWTLGLVPLAMSFAAGVFLCRRIEQWLVLAAIFSLHVAHVPYWFVGIMNWHYVFESAPLWCLWFALVSGDLLNGWRNQGRGIMAAWWLGLLLIAGLTSYVPVAGVWNGCRVDAAIGEILYPRRRYAAFADRLKTLSIERGLVLIEGDPADRSFDLIVNQPEFQDRFIRGRLPPGKAEITRLRDEFPDRRIIIYRVRTGQFERVD